MNSCRLYIDIKENDLIIFPGWLQHGTTPNLSDSSRIMIGANYFLKGSIGDENNWFLALDKPTLLNYMNPTISKAVCIC